MASSPLHPGTQRALSIMSPTVAGEQRIYFSNEADTLLLTLYASNVTGTLDLTVYNSIRLADGTYRRSGAAIEFPTLTAATSEILLRRAAVTTEQVEVVITYSAACSFEVYARAIQAGISDTRILGAASLRVSQVDVSTTAVLLIGASLQDRAGLVVKNWSTAGDLFLGESMAKATLAVGYPLAPRDALAVDLAAGQEVWGVASAGTIDVRLGEAGGG